MRKITKSHCPACLTKWRTDNKDGNHSYDSLRGTEAHISLREQLLKEQGYICAYTGKTIDENVSHCEHLKPQTLCQGWEDVEYRNIVACFPKSGGDESFGYGAPMKGNWWDEALFLSPLDEICARCFEFTWSGKIKVRDSVHKEKAQAMVDRLQLDHKNLREERRRVINGYFRWTSNVKIKKLSTPEAVRCLSGLKEFNGRTKLPEFAFMLEQLLERYIASNGTRS